MRLHRPEYEVTLPVPPRSGFERATKCIMHTSIWCLPERLARIKTVRVRTRHLRLCHSSKNLHVGFLFKYSLSDEISKRSKGLFLFFFVSRWKRFLFPLSDDESTNGATAEVKGEITSSASGWLQRKKVSPNLPVQLIVLVFFSKRE